jgi:hypothetical protein
VRRAKIAAKHDISDYVAPDAGDAGRNGTKIKLTPIDGNAKMRTNH